MEIGLRFDNYGLIYKFYLRFQLLLEDYDWKQ